MCGCGVVFEGTALAQVLCDGGVRGSLVPFVGQALPALGQVCVMGPSVAHLCLLENPLTTRWRKCCVLALCVAHLCPL